MNSSSIESSWVVMQSVIYVTNYLFTKIGDQVEFGCPGSQHQTRFTDSHHYYYLHKQPHTLTHIDSVVRVSYIDFNAPLVRACLVHMRVCGVCVVLAHRNKNTFFWRKSALQQQKSVFQYMCTQSQHNMTHFCADTEDILQVMACTHGIKIIDLNLMLWFGCVYVVRRAMCLCRHPCRCRNGIDESHHRRQQKQHR